MPLSLFEPRVLIALALVLVLSSAGSYLKGRGDGADLEQAKWVLAMDQAKAEQEKKLEAERTAKADKEKELLALNHETEKKYAAAMQEVNDMYVVNGRFVAATGGLYDKNGRPTGKASAGADRDSAAAGGDGDGAAGCQLSTQTSNDLLDLSYDADRAAVFAGVCKAYATELRGLLENSCRAVVPGVP